MLSKVFAIAIILVFYIIYIGKMYLQSKQGIKTDQLGKDKKHNKTYYIELLLKIFSYAIVLVQVLSIILLKGNKSVAFIVIALLIGIIADSIFFISVYTMKDSWRAGIPSEDKTELKTTGIYSYSRNPAFVGFDLYYLSILIMFFNYPLLIVTIMTMILFHLQILEEEKYLTKTFGSDYISYKNKVRRYL